MKKRLILSFLTLLTPFILLAQEAEKGLDERINEAVEPIAAAIAKVVFFAIPLATLVHAVSKTWFTKKVSLKRQNSLHHEQKETT